MQVHLCFPVVVAAPLQLRRSPGISLVLALLLRSRMGCLGLPSVLLSPGPPTPYQPVTTVSVENGEPGAELGSVYVSPPPCPAVAGQHLHQPALIMAAKGRRNQRRTPRLGKAVAQRSLELVAPASLFHKDIFRREDFTSVCEEMSGQGMGWRCSFCY